MSFEMSAMASKSDYGEPLLGGSVSGTDSTAYNVSKRKIRLQEKKETAKNRALDSFDFDIQESQV